MKDKKVELFKPMDFRPCEGMRDASEYAAKLANEVLNKKLAECPRVYGSPESGDWDLDIKKGVHPTYTHTALLFDVQPIVEESSADVLAWQIKHAEPVAYNFCFGDGSYERAKAALKREGKL